MSLHLNLQCQRAQKAEQHVPPHLSGGSPLSSLLRKREKNRNRSSPRRGLIYVRLPDPSTPLSKFISNFLCDGRFIRSSTCVMLGDSQLCRVSNASTPYVALCRGIMGYHRGDPRGVALVAAEEAVMIHPLTSCGSGIHPTEPTASI